MIPISIRACLRSATGRSRVHLGRPPQQVAALLVRVLLEHVQAELEEGGRVLRVLVQRVSQAMTLAALARTVSSVRGNCPGPWKPLR